MTVANHTTYVARKQHDLVLATPKQHGERNDSRKRDCNQAEKLTYRQTQKTFNQNKYGTGNQLL